jgi:hypothetical protein
VAQRGTTRKQGKGRAETRHGIHHGIALVTPACVLIVNDRPLRDRQPTHAEPASAAQGFVGVDQPQGPHPQAKQWRTSGLPRPAVTAIADTVQTRQPTQPEYIGFTCTFAVRPHDGKSRERAFGRVANQVFHSVEAVEARARHQAMNDRRNLRSGDICDDRALKDRGRGGVGATRLPPAIIDLSPSFRGRFSQDFLGPKKIRFPLFRRGPVLKNPGLCHE